MRIETRIVIAFSAFIYCVWAMATEVRHFAGSPDGLLRFLYWTPASGCLLTLIGLAWENQSGAAPQWGAVKPWREIPPLALALQYIGLGLLAWRSLWMFFSWDGMFLFPACLLLLASLYRYHPRWIPQA